MNILDRAKAHFRDKLNNGLICIEVPEWGEDNEPAKLYFKPYLTLLEQAEAAKLINDDSVKGLAGLLIMRALDEEGNRVFAKTNERELMNSVDPDVIGRIFQNLQHQVQVIELESIKGN